MYRKDHHSQFITITILLFKNSSSQFIVSNVRINYFKDSKAITIDQHLRILYSLIETFHNTLLLLFIIFIIRWIIKSVNTKLRYNAIPPGHHSYLKSNFRLNLHILLNLQSSVSNHCASQDALTDCYVHGKQNINIWPIIKSTNMPKLCMFWLVHLLIHVYTYTSS